MRARLRRAQAALAALAGLPAGGFLIPYRHAAAARPEGYPALDALFRAALPTFRSRLDGAAALAADLGRIAAEGPGLLGPRPARFTQDWFPRLDAAIAYALVRQERPRRIIEIGSGHSTRFMAQAVADGGLPTAITCIDPQPRAPLPASPRLRHEARLFGPGDVAGAAALERGDILFIDSSHVAMPGTDVDRLLLDVLPRLAPGVLVHLHDVFLPDAYPLEWAWRGYNEQVAVGALIQGGAFALDFASRYVATRTGWLDAGPLAGLPLVPGAFETSLWLRKG
ncbi:class I SAM-dependent methyltransferase [Methylobacterium sp. ID0610]|uniref:class I SAM-dependent methyltransferase n=1 Tax=Methylobacterium carpenticola TaxID=3344827 RepID=UPI0036A731C5